MPNYESRAKKEHGGEHRTLVVCNLLHHCYFTYLYAYFLKARYFVDYMESDIVTFRMSIVG